MTPTEILSTEHAARASAPAAFFYARKDRGRHA
jgi:hypothetical protein